MKSVDVSRSPDNRLMTSLYSKGEGVVFCLAEQTKNGALITEFSEKGEVLNQVYTKGAASEAAFRVYLGSEILPEITATEAYSGVKLKAKCTGCKGSVIVRDLDEKRPEEITEVPVIPLFTCTSCRKKFYSMTNRYMRHLVEENISLFEDEELKDKAKDSDAFINTLKEYIVRIFASKKISRIVVE